MFERFVDDTSDYLISVTDSSGKIIHVNKKFQDISKYSESELLGNSHRLIESGYHDVGFYRNLWRTSLNGEIWTGFIKNKAKDGTYYWVRSTTIPMLNTNKKPYQHICISTKLEHPYEELLDFTDIENIQKVLDQSSIVAITDKDGTITYANKKFCDISKYSKEELIGQNHRILKSGLHPPLFFSQMWNTISNGKIWQGDIKNKAKDGTYYWMRTTIMPISDHKHNTKQFVSIRTDVTELYEAKAIILEQFKEIKKFNKILVEKEQLMINQLDEIPDHVTRLEKALYDNEESKKLIQSQLEELKETDVKKDEFAAMFSHELKTPLVPIMGYAELLKTPEMSMTAEQLECVNEIYANAERLESLVSDVLDVQKLSMRAMKFNKAKLDLKEFFTRIKISSAPLLSEKQIHLDVSSTNIIIDTDECRLYQVFSNLIRNAVDFVPNSGMIEIGAKSQKDDVLFFVKDNGIGIPKEKQKSLFKKFYQIDTSVIRKHGGTGLGLTICSEIIEGLGGRIWVESEEGKGTTFYFTIPKTIYSDR